MDELRVCDIDAVADGAARGFEPRDRLLVIVLRREGRFAVYANRCPHLGTPLELAPDHFLDADATHLVCSTHGAEFRVEDGYCVSGPCAGDALESLDVFERDGALWLRVAPDAG